MNPITYAFVYGSIITGLTIALSQFAGLEITPAQYLLVGGSAFLAGFASASFIGAEHWFFRLLAAGLVNGVATNVVWATGLVPKPELAPDAGGA